MPFEHGLEHEGQQGKQAQQRSHRESSDKVVLVVKNLDMERHGIGKSTDMTRDHRYRAELAHGAGIAEEHAIQQAPLDVGQSNPPEDLEAAGAEHTRRLLLLAAL